MGQYILFFSKLEISIPVSIHLFAKSMWPMLHTMHSCLGMKPGNPMYMHMALKHQLGALLGRTITSFLHFSNLHASSNPVNIGYWVIMYGYFHTE
jgi:hypothetical protein